MLTRRIVAIAALILPPLLGQTQSPEVLQAAERSRETESHLDLVYAERGERKMHLDLFVPVGKAEPRPAILVVHGGGWLKGDKEKFRPLAQALAQRGYVTAAVEYRLGGEAKFPAAIHDCNTATRWLRV